MSSSERPSRAEFDREYAEYSRRMQLFEDGPTTTRFEQLIAKGIELPPPDSIPDDAIRKKLWEVIHGLSELRAYLRDTDHLTDRELYAKLWHTTLRGEVPAINEIGFNQELPLVDCGAFEEDTLLYLKHYADETFREGWREEFPDQTIPDYEDPPYKRDCLLPCAEYEGMPEAAEWLRATWSSSALASNRFGSTECALTFVEQLYAAGATFVAIDNIMMLPNHDWTPYADTLIVDLPEDAARRRALFALMKDVGRPDEDGPDPIDEQLLDHGQSSVRLWWD